MHVNVHTLVKCPYGRETLWGEDIQGMNSKVLVCSGNERVDKKEETCSLTKCYHTVCKAGMEGVFDMMGQLSVQQLAVCVCVILGDLTARIANPNNG